MALRGFPARRSGSRLSSHLGPGEADRGAGPASATSPWRGVACQGPVHSLWERERRPRKRERSRGSGLVLRSSRGRRPLRRGRRGRLVPPWRPPASPETPGWKRRLSRPGAPPREGEGTAPRRRPPPAPPARRGPRRTPGGGAPAPRGDLRRQGGGGLEDLPGEGQGSPPSRAPSRSTPTSPSPSTRPYPAAQGALPDRVRGPPPRTPRWRDPSPRPASCRSPGT